MFPHIQKQLLDKMKEAIEEKDAAPALLNDELQNRDNQLALISDDSYESQKQMAKLQREISKLNQDTANLQVAVERLERRVVPHLEGYKKRQWNGNYTEKQWRF